MNDETQKMIDEIMKSDSFKGLVESALVDKVVGSFYKYTMEGLMLEPAFRTILREEMAKAISEYFENYYETRSIRNQVEDCIKSMTKADILKLISGKLL